MGILAELSRPLSIGQRVIGRALFIKFSDGTMKMFDAIDLGCQWFKMTNEAFYNMYGFNYNPHEFGLYESCRKIVCDTGGLLL